MIRRLALQQTASAPPHLVRAAIPGDLGEGIIGVGYYTFLVAEQHPFHDLGEHSLKKVRRRNGHGVRSNSNRLLVSGVTRRCEK
jgi:hypothetical protein